MIPAADREKKAIIKNVTVSHEDACLMPLEASPKNFSKVINSMIGRPYGWGSLYFYNDCSSELRNLFTPFGIWLPRHSSKQVSIGKIVDMSSFTEQERLSYLMNNGDRFLTIVYIGGHVFLYIGNFPNPNDPTSTMVMCYQNIWGLAPRPADRRAIIGKAVLFPLLLNYPEDPNLHTLAGHKYFKVCFLNKPSFSSFKKEDGLDLNTLMFPDC